jgi:hypothetical protein
LANALERGLAYIWHDHKPYEPKRLFAKLRELFFAFSEYAGTSEEVLRWHIRRAEIEFFDKHGFEITFKTPVQEIVWADKVALPDWWKGCFVIDGQISLILRALELLHILNKAGVTPPYKRYLINFQPLSFYDNIQLPETE